MTTYGGLSGLGGQPQPAFNPQNLTLDQFMRAMMMNPGQADDFFHPDFDLRQWGISRQDPFGVEGPPEAGSYWGPSLGGGLNALNFMNLAVRPRDSLPRGLNNGTPGEGNAVTRISRPVPTERELQDAQKQFSELMTSYQDWQKQRELQRAGALAQQQQGYALQDFVRWSDRDPSIRAMGLDATDREYLGRQALGMGTDGVAANTNRFMGVDPEAAWYGVMGGHTYGDMAPGDIGWASSWANNAPMQQTNSWAEGATGAFQGYQQDQAANQQAQQQAYNIANNNPFPGGVINSNYGTPWWGVVGQVGNTQQQQPMMGANNQPLPQTPAGGWGTPTTNQTQGTTPNYSGGGNYAAAPAKNPWAGGGGQQQTQTWGGPFTNKNPWAPSA